MNGTRYRQKERVPTYARKPAQEWIPLEQVAQVWNCSVADAYVRLQQYRVERREAHREEVCLYGAVPLFDSKRVQGLRPASARSRQEAV